MQPENYGKFIIMSDNVEEDLTLSQSDISCISQIMAQSIREAQIKIQREIELGEDYMS